MPVVLGHAVLAGLADGTASSMITGRLEAGEHSLKPETALENALRSPSVRDCGRGFPELRCRRKDTR
jgi:hypothetical protein